MPSNMPDQRSINEALRRAREMQSRGRAAEVSPLEELQAAPQKADTQADEIQPKYNKAAASPLDLLMKDRERVLILALLILLSGENGSTELLFALMYLLI